jgi:hypothetical protein
MNVTPTRNVALDPYRRARRIVPSPNATLQARSNEPMKETVEAEVCTIMEESRAVWRTPQQSIMELIQNVRYGGAEYNYPAVAAVWDDCCAEGWFGGCWRGGRCL